MTQLKKINKMNLLEADIGVEYIVKDVNTDDDEVDTLLFTLGCYKGEPITVVLKPLGSYIVAIKNGRYIFDYPIASAITIEKVE